MVTKSKKEKQVTKEPRCFHVETDPIKLCLNKPQWFIPWPLGYYGKTRPMVYLCDICKQKIYSLAEKLYDDWDEYKKEIEKGSQKLEEKKDEGLQPRSIPKSRAKGSSVRKNIKKSSSI